ncbi:aminotransferase class V-fold PLP-dependent enzyme [Neolewinella agarilytica]|uniref:Selenocysteine lyase/Cysteine desulfurase n=1 Tax=Neolewinella agarilytica TaxID=478744 RepID=A0A1H9BFB7_9BACT|nr:aminotransferase class V-fold PLP-dependent enzyme [Neolewinella agarilytica]SEP87575.1 Selenocysteine lyase/Cysteine desulfurase [Neolewinella agarilytica]
MLNRRNWLRQSVLATAGAALLAPAGLQALNDRQTRLYEQLATPGSDEAYWEMVKSQFSFAPGLTYFNNGSLGACPDHVSQATNEFRKTLDGFPSRYMWGGWDDEKEAVREKVAETFAVSPETIALIHNTTEGMNLIASSMELEEGDEVLLSSHEHTSARVPWKYWQERKGVVLKDVELPLLPKSREEIVELFRQAITPKTKVISIVHVTNTNGMRLPVREISDMAHERGVLVAVDGAQSMGMFRINLDELGCDFFTSSSHKWLFSPKGMGVFYAREEAQKWLKPLIVCRGWEDTSIRRLENYNTRNLPELLGLGAALDFRSLIGQERIEQRIFELKHYFRELLNSDDRFALKTPAPDGLSAGIQTVEVLGKNAAEVRKALSDNHGIDCRPMTAHSINGLRISLAIYCTKADVDRLVKALAG